jgi:hypothetical protein
MKIDIRHFAVLRKSLENERDALRARLFEINAALGLESGSDSPVPSVSSILAPRQSPKKQPRRVTTPSRRAAAAATKLTMRDAIKIATARRALGIGDLVGAMQQLGYQFTSKKPANSLGAYLYGPSGKEHFKRVDGRFTAK